MSSSDQHRPPGGDTQLRFPLPTGTRVDHYVIREVLGAGGFGITYLAEHEALGKLYAIKEYFPHAFSYRHGLSVRPTSAGDGTYKWGLERFITEARALARFKHASIVDVTSVFESNGTAYIVLAYENGVDMTQWLKQLGRPPSQEELDRVLMPLLAALEEVHRNNIMHRDISPDNLLIREDGRPVLIDFGSARESIRGRARAMSAIVKHGYSPPEQYTSRPDLQGPWTDIYALAATLYRAISGKLPPDATERIVRDELLPIARLAEAAYRPSFLESIDRGLFMKVEERPQTIVEWREMLFRPEAVRQPQRRQSAERRDDPAGPSARAQPSAQRPTPDQRPAQTPSSTGAKPTVSRVPSSVRAGDRDQFPAGASLSPRQGVVSTPRSDAPRPASRNLGSARISDGSMRKSERPDLSWIDEAEQAELLPADEPPPKGASIGQLITYGFLGLLAGAVGGAMLSVVVASVVSTSCFADSCIFRYASIASGIGGIAGIFAAVRIASHQAKVADVTQSALRRSNQL